MLAMCNVCASTSSFCWTLESCPFSPFINNKRWPFSYMTSIKRDPYISISITIAYHSSAVLFPTQYRSWTCCWSPCGRDHDTRPRWTLPGSRKRIIQTLLFDWCFLIVHMDVDIFVTLISFAPQEGWTLLENSSACCRYCLPHGTLHIDINTYFGIK